MSIDFDLTTLRLFEAAVRLGSISAAANEQNIAVSAISRRISDMEHRLGTALLYRAVRGVEPTPAGKVLLGHARNLLRLSRRAAEDMADFADGSRGLVRVAANPSATHQFLPDAFATFWAANPGVRFELKEDMSDVIVESVRDGHVDIGVFSGVVPHADIETFSFRRDHLSAVVPASHRFADRATLSFADIMNEPHVALEDETSLFQQCVALAKESGVRLNVTVRARSFDGVRRMVSKGLGLGILPRDVAQPYAASDGLAVIEIDDPWAEREFLIGVRERHALSQSSALFLDHLLKTV